MADLAEVATVEQAWRPLTPVEKSRALYYLGMASRKIRRRWPNVDARIADPADALDAEDVADVVVQMVLPAIQVLPVRGAKSFSEGSGPFSRSATLEQTSADPLEIEDWMVDVFEPRAKVLPLGSFPAAPDSSSLFIVKEGAY